MYRVDQKSGARLTAHSVHFNYHSQDNVNAQNITDQDFTLYAILVKFPNCIYVE